ADAHTFWEVVNLNVSDQAGQPAGHAQRLGNGGSPSFQHRVCSRQSFTSLAFTEKSLMSSIEGNFSNLPLSEKIFHLHQIGVETTLSVLKFIPGLPFKGVDAIGELTALPISAMRGIMAGLSGTPATTDTSAPAAKSAASEEPKRIVLTTKS
ncbi:MAG: hypothetical protein ACUVR8_13425, partial [Acidobacteriota bacterium]